MTSFVSPDFPSAHGGLIRMANGLDSAQSLISKVNSAKGMAGALVVGGLAAAIVVAEQVVNAWADGHLLLAWIALWAIVFALLTVFSGVIRNWSGQLRADLQTRLAARREAASDRRTWSAALGDPRQRHHLAHQGDGRTRHRSPARRTGCDRSRRRTSAAAICQASCFASANLATDLKPQLDRPPIARQGLQSSRSHG